MDISAGSAPADLILTGGSRDEHKHLDLIYAKQICSWKHLISLQFFNKMHFRDENNILHRIYEEQICLDYK